MVLQEQALQIAETANKAKNAFLGSVSHDIRTPMNAIIRPQAKAKDQTFDILVTPLKYELLQGDKLRINQSLINLLSNSVKYTPAGGRIEMRVEELPQVMKTYSRVRFAVSDNGMGMSELKEIFDPFTREETKANCGIQGTGLGMAITKSLMDVQMSVLDSKKEQ